MENRKSTEMSGARAAVVTERDASVVVTGGGHCGIGSAGINVPLGSGEPGGGVSSGRCRGGGRVGGLEGGSVRSSSGSVSLARGEGREGDALVAVAEEAATAPRGQR